MRVKLPTKLELQDSQSSDEDSDIEFNDGTKERNRIKREAEMRKTK